MSLNSPKEYPISLLEEDIPMTMQVGMIGTDGIVLASDTKWAQSTMRGTGSIRGSFSASKIKISHQRGIAISCARNMETAVPVADAIIAELSDDDMVMPIIPMERLAQGVIDQAGVRNDVHCLIVLSRPCLQLYRLRTIGSNIRCDAGIGGHVITGDLENSALFWAERYYERRPIDYLARVAAQLIVMAGKTNSAMVGGLEVVLCNASSFRRLSAESNATLEAAANELDEIVRRSFASPLQQFTYAPDMVS